MLTLLLLAPLVLLGCIYVVGGFLTTLVAWIPMYAYGVSWKWWLAYGLMTIGWLELFVRRDDIGHFMEKHYADKVDRFMERHCADRVDGTRD